MAHFLDKKADVCVICGGALQEAPSFRDLPRVTSDSRPFRHGGRIASCRVCTAIQKFADDQWFADIEEIYRAYDMYHQSGALDQPVFDPRTGRSRPRSSVLIDFLALAEGLPERGRALDVGCGNGAFLAALSGVRPGWRLSGTDLSARNESILATIQGFEALHVCPLDSILGQYDVVSLIHSLEHLPRPVESLAALVERLLPGGRVFIQVPDVAATPFDLVVADHLSHFSTLSLTEAVRRAGLHVQRVSHRVITKEITLVARASNASTGDIDLRPSRRCLAEQVEWLERMVETAKQAAEHERFGLFGTSIASIWLLAALEDRVSFFVDEDPARIGRALFGRPVLAPSQVAGDAKVMLALIPEVAAAVKRRLSSLPITFVLPPDTDSVARRHQ